MGRSPSTLTLGTVVNPQDPIASIDFARSRPPRPSRPRRACAAADFKAVWSSLREGPVTLHVSGHRQAVTRITEASLDPPAILVSLGEPSPAVDAMMCERRFELVGGARRPTRITFAVVRWIRGGRSDLVFLAEALDAGAEDAAAAAAESEPR